MGVGLIFVLLGGDFNWFCITLVNFWKYCSCSQEILDFDSVGTHSISHSAQNSSVVLTGHSSFECFRHFRYTSLHCFFEDYLKHLLYSGDSTPPIFPFLWVPNVFELCREAGSAGAFFCTNCKSVIPLIPWANTYWVEQVALSALPVSVLALTCQVRRGDHTWSRGLQHIFPKMRWKEHSTMSEQTVCLQLARLAEIQHEITDLILFRINLLWSLLNQAIWWVPNLVSS